MNVERLYAALNIIRNENRKRKVVSEVEELIVLLKQSVEAPSDEANGAFKTKYAQIIGMLTSCESNNVGPTTRMVYSDIGATDKLGVGLLSRIKDTISDNNITPSSALSGLSKIRDEVGDFHTNVKQILSGLNKFGIEPDVIDPGEYEIGVSIPRDNIGGDLSSLIKEFKIIDQSFRPFNELVGAEVISCKLRSISSSEWQVFLDSAPIVSVVIITALERAVALYKNILDTIKLHKEMVKKDYPEKILSASQDHIDEKLQNDIRQVAEGIVDEEYKGQDEARKKELISDISFSLRFLVKKIDGGVTIEVKTELTKEPEKPKVPIKPDELEKQSKEIQDEYAKSIAIYNGEQKEYGINLEHYKMQLAISDKIHTCNDNILKLRNGNDSVLKISLDDTDTDTDTDTD